VETGEKQMEALSTTEADTEQAPFGEPMLPSFEVYARQVCLYYNGSEHTELKQLLRELGRIFGTKNQSETVLRALRRMYECEIAVENLFALRTRD
jgi:hypothetical protein